MIISFKIFFKSVINSVQHLKNDDLYTSKNYLDKKLFQFYNMYRRFISIFQNTTN